MKYTLQKMFLVLCSLFFVRYLEQSSLDVGTKYQDLKTKNQERTSHSNCSRKRISFSNKSRISSRLYINAAMRSMPRPKAKPENSSGSTPAARSTLGCTIPDPPSSIQPEFLQIRQHAQPHLKPLKSNSA